MAEKNQTISNQSITVEQKQKDLQNDLAKLNEVRPAGAMAILPQDANFETKDQEEQVILVMRKHSITNLPWIIMTTLLVFVPVLIVSLGFYPESIEAKYRLLLFL